MPYKPIEVDRKNLTIMGVPFPDLAALESAANAIGSNMFEGFEPTPKSIAIIRDYITEKITFADIIQIAKEKAYA
jgi:putative transcriptional regulator